MAAVGVIYASDRIGRLCEGVVSCELDAVIDKADILSLHCPLTARNEAMINRKTISRMRDGAILINTARGGLVDEAALLDALRTGKLKSVALDSFCSESLSPTSPLMTHPSVIMTPHVAGITADSYINMGVSAARGVLSALEYVEPVKV